MPKLLQFKGYSPNETGVPGQWAELRGPISFKRDGDSNDFWAGILRPGTFVDSTGQEFKVTYDWLRWAEMSFDHFYPDLLQPPLRLGGHDPDIAPAFGWITAMRVMGQGEKAMLMARLHVVSDWAMEAIRKGMFKKVSAGIWLDFEYEDNTHPVVINHLAVLGARLPAVTGLPDLQALLGISDPLELAATVEAPPEPEKVLVFSIDGDADPGVPFHKDESQVRETPPNEEIDMDKLTELVAAIGKLTSQIAAERDDSKRGLLEASLADLNKKVEGIEADRVAEKARADKAEKTLEAERKTAADEKAAASKAAVKVRLEAASKDGKLAPKRLPAVLEIAAALDDSKAEIEFEAADGKKEKVSAQECFLGMIEGGSNVVDFSERAGEDTERQDPAAKGRKDSLVGRPSGGEFAAEMDIGDKIIADEEKKADSSAE